MAYTDIKNVINFFEPPVVESNNERINGHISDLSRLALDIVFKDNEVKDVIIKPGPTTCRLIEQADKKNSLCTDGNMQCIRISKYAIVKSENIKSGYVLSMIDHYGNNTLYYYTIEKAPSGEIKKIKSTSKYFVTAAEKELIDLIERKLPIKEGRTLIFINDSSIPATLEITFDINAPFQITYTCVRHHKFGEKSWKTKQNGEFRSAFDGAGRLHSINDVIAQIIANIYDSATPGYLLIDHSPL